MDIVSFNDAEKYLGNKQVYFKKGIVDVNLRTIVSAERVHDIGDVSAEMISNQTIALYITVDGKENAIYKECTDFDFFAWIKQNYIPVQDLVACWISNYYIK